MVMCVVGPRAPALMATLSSPVWMKLWVMVTLVELPGSMPSVLRALGGRLTFTPHTVKPLPLL